MSELSKRRRAQTALATVAVGGLLAAGLTATANGSAVAASPVADSADLQETYINYVAPNVEHGKSQEKVNKKALKEAQELDRKHAAGNPVAARQLAKLERKAIKTGENPRKIKKAPSTQEARLLTILVEFDPNKTYDWSGVMVPKTVFGDRTCVPATNVPNGPLHNKIPNPANFATTPGSAPDNNSFWVSDFSPEHFDKMLYTETGITERVRPDLTGPDGKPGIDISGYTMKNMYEEMSKNAYTVDGAATNWVKVDNSEAFYAADTCTLEDGVWDAGRQQDMNGHPSNPRGAGQLAIDAVQALAVQQPGFPFADYDIEDQGDLDEDGNLFEPDGVIDHVVLVHAGEDKSGGGGAEGTYAIWAHSSSVPGGATIPGTGGLKLSNYIVQPEDSGVGVFAHEYGHDLGLPDLYDNSSGGESDIDFWDLMSSGSHSGPIFQSMPTHMGIWDKWVLGWADPRVFEPGSKAATVQLGQTSRTPRGSEDGIKINLPTKTLTLAEPHSGANMWWSGNDQDWADNRLTRTVAVPAGSDVRFSMWNDYVIEEDWDFGFVEVSTNGGSTWTEQKVYNAAGEEVTTPDGYTDPNGRMADFGNKKYGLTGHTDGMEQQHIKLTPFAGQTIQVRLRYATDEAFVERGWFADDFAVTNGATTVWSDDVEGGVKDWTTTIGTFIPGEPLGAGWRIDTGTSSANQYYLAEWRNYDGFDEGLKYAYDTTYSNFGPWKVEKIKYNAPGMLVWYRDTSYGNANPVLATTYDLPSTGSKGGLLLVDSHFDPFRRTGVAAAKDPSTLNNMASRPQSSNVAFGQSTYPFQECLAEVPGEDWRNQYCTSIGSQPAVDTFTDAKGWYPGIEIRGSSLFFRDIDASTVLPNGDNEPYSVRVVDQNGNPLPEFYGEDIGVGVPLGTGNPTKPFGVQLTVQKSKQGNTIGQIRVQPAK